MNKHYLSYIVAIPELHSCHTDLGQECKQTVKSHLQYTDFAAHQNNAPALSTSEKEISTAKTRWGSQNQMLVLVVIPELPGNHKGA